MGSIEYEIYSNNLSKVFMDLLNKNVFLNQGIKFDRKTNKGIIINCRNIYLFNELLDLNKEWLKKDTKQIEFNEQNFGWYNELKRLKFKSYKEYYCFMEELHEYLKIKRWNL